MLFRKTRAGLNSKARFLGALPSTSGAKARFLFIESLGMAEAMPFQNHPGALSKPAARTG